MAEIYIVEDEGDIRELVIYALTSAGFSAKGFESGATFFPALEKEETPDLIILDIMLPETDGVFILKKIRGVPKYAKIPVIMLTAKSAEYDKVKCLDMGADDYITKPFGVTELISRVNAVLRRYLPEEKSATLSYGAIAVDDSKREVTAGGAKVTLTYKEYELLCRLIKNAGIVLSREKLLETVWGYGFEGESRTVDVHIKTLRQKLGDCGGYIKTIRNVGYKLRE